MFQSLAIQHFRGFGKLESTLLFLRSRDQHVDEVREFLHSFAKGPRRLLTKHPHGHDNGFVLARWRRGIGCA